MPLPRTSYMTTRTGELPADDDPLLAFDPVPHKAPRRNSIGPERQRAFVAHLAATGIVTQAAKHIGASMEALYKLRHRPGAEAFAAAWDAAVDRGVLRLEDCALGRAIEGEERMVVSAGQVLGTERRHNEALVTFFLRHRRPERYAADQQPGHPLYERIRAEVLEEAALERRAREAAERARLEARRTELIELYPEGEEAGEPSAREAGDSAEDGGELSRAEAYERAMLRQQYPLLTEADLDEIMGSAPPAED